MTTVHPPSSAPGLNERPPQLPRINDELSAAASSGRSSLDALLNQDPPPAPYPGNAVSGVNGVERHESLATSQTHSQIAAEPPRSTNSPSTSSPQTVADSRRQQACRDSDDSPRSHASSQAQSKPAPQQAREALKSQQQLPSRPPPLTLAIAPRDLDRDMRPISSPAQATTAASQTNTVKSNNRRQQALPAENGNGIPEHLIRDVSYVPKRRGRPPAAPTNGYERVLSPVAPSPATAPPESHTEALRMALETISRESARAGALQAQLTRALEDVQHLRAKEQAMLTEFEHRVARAVKHHQQKFDATLATQRARIEELEERLSLTEGGHLKHDADSQTVVPDNDSQRTTSLSPMTTEDAAKALLSAKHPHIHRRPLRPASRSASPSQRSPTEAMAPPSRPNSRQSHTSSVIPANSAHVSRASMGRFPADVSHPGNTFAGAHDKRPADCMDVSRDDASSVAGSERSAKRRRTASGSSAADRAPPAQVAASSDPIARMRAHVAGGAPVPEYDLHRIKLIYEPDSKGNHVCRVCTMHSESGQTVGFPVGTPDIDLVLHGMGAHPGLWHSPMAAKTPHP